MALPCGHTSDEHDAHALTGERCAHQFIDRLLSDLLSADIHDAVPTLDIMRHLWEQYETRPPGAAVIVPRPADVSCREAGWAMLLSAGLRRMIVDGTSASLSPIWLEKQPILDQRLDSLAREEQPDSCCVCRAHGATGLSNGDLLVECAALAVSILKGCGYTPGQIYRQISTARLSQPAAQN